MPDPADLQTRHRRYERERRGVALFAAAPLLVLYVLTHSSWLKTQLPASKEMAVLYLIVLPLAWFGLVMGLHAWAGPIRHALRCDACRHRLVGREFERAMAAQRCPACSHGIPGAQA